MARKLALVLAGVLIGAVAAGTVVSASAKSPAPQPTGVTYLDHTVNSGFSDLGKKGFSPGDEFFFHDVLKQGGTTKGTVDGFCKLTAFKPAATGTCSATGKIGASQLEFQTGGAGALNGKQPFKVAITGGTGAYRTARGYVLIKPINKNDSHFTIYVMP